MNYFLIFLKGIAMGAADVVPGISGGTIAFITGIYDTLLESIRRVNPALIKRYKHEGLASVFTHINGRFLITLMAGILLSIVSLAKLITWLLETHPIPVWSFFFGLIMVSSYHMIKQVKRFSALKGLVFALGAFVAYGITILSPSTLEFSYVNIFLAGSLAICAMILPGISGSFILLLLGMYAPILSAVKHLHLDVLALFASGCLVGLLVFSHFLSWLLKHHRDVALTFLTGLMLGTLPKIWPWKHESQLLPSAAEHSDTTSPILSNVSPFAYEHLTNQPSQLLLAIALVIAAFALVLGLERLGQSK